MDIAILFPSAIVVVDIVVVVVVIVVVVVQVFSSFETKEHCAQILPCQLIIAMCVPMAQGPKLFHLICVGVCVLVLVFWSVGGGGVRLFVLVVLVELQGGEGYCSLVFVIVSICLAS